MKAVCPQEGHHARVDGKPGHVAPGGLPRGRIPGVQGTRHVGGPRLDLGDQRHGVAGPAGEFARPAPARCARCRPLETLPRAGDRAVRVGQPRRPQHPRHPAQAGRRARVVRRAEDLSGQPGRERSEFHVRRRREPGRPPGRPVARDAHSSGAGRSGARAHVGAAFREALRRRRAHASVVAHEA